MTEAVAETSQTAPTTREAANAWLCARARRIVQAHLSTRDDADFARSVKSMIDQTVHEYGGRFLFELVQNGYDEQDPERTDGRIVIILARDELEHGVLYAANTGHGFSASNVRAIANLGLSDKEVGEGIGNKGVGFKSVLQICDAPEIYSTLPDGTPGFCFRFAQARDISGLVDDDPTSVRQVLEEMSLYSITVPADTTPERVTTLWSEGYSSVIRMPLRSNALEVAAEGLDDLAGSTAPVLLFLRRLRQITVRQERGDEVTETVLARRSEDVPDLDGDPQSELVTLGDDDRFLAFTREVPTELVANVVNEAVEAHKLDARWARAKSAVEVSIAVPYGAQVATAGRFFTYLPLGAKAPSPFAGHLNAPFATNLSRTDIDEDHPLNQLLLSAAAQLCLDAADALTAWSNCAPDMVLDVVSWDADRASYVVDQAAAQGRPLAARSLAPTRAPGRWTSFEEIWRWPTSDTQMLTAARVADACHVDFLPDLGQGRAERLDVLLDALELCADASGEELAAWTEALLEEMRAKQRPAAEWDQAYADIARVFAGQELALRSRRILLTDDWELRPCAGDGRSTDGAASRRRPRSSRPLANPWMTRTTSTPRPISTSPNRSAIACSI